MLTHSFKLQFACFLVQLECARVSQPENERHMIYFGTRVRVMHREGEKQTGKANDIMTSSWHTHFKRSLQGKAKRPKHARSKRGRTRGPQNKEENVKTHMRKRQARRTSLNNVIDYPTNKECLYCPAPAPLWPCVVGICKQMWSWNNSRPHDTSKTNLIGNNDQEYAIEWWIMAWMIHFQTQLKSRVHSWLLLILPWVIAKSIFTVDC